MPHVSSIAVFPLTISSEMEQGSSRSRYAHITIRVYTRLHAGCSRLLNADLLADT